MAEGSHLFPFRTEKLSPPAPMVLPGKPGGRVGCRPLCFDAPVSSDPGASLFSCERNRPYPRERRRTGRSRMGRAVQIQQCQRCPPSPCPPMISCAAGGTRPCGTASASKEDRYPSACPGLEGSEVLRRFLMSVFVASLATWIPSAALAQVPTLDRVQQELARTDERIHQAELLLAGNTNVQASAEIETAKARQDEARAALAAARPRMALDLTLDARLHADRAVAFLRGVDPTRVQEQIDRAREYIDRARERLNECPVDRARSQLHVAEAMLDRSQEALTAGRPLAALQPARGAPEHARPALQSRRIDHPAQDGAGRALPPTDQ